MKEQYFYQLSRILMKNGIQTESPTETIRPVLYDGKPCCHVGKNGTVFVCPRHGNMTAGRHCAAGGKRGSGSLISGGDFLMAQLLREDHSACSLYPAFIEPFRQKWLIPACFAEKYNDPPDPTPAHRVYQPGERLESGPAGEETLWELFTAAVNGRDKTTG